MFKRIILVLATLLAGAAAGASPAGAVTAAPHPAGTQQDLNRLAFPTASAKRDTTPATSAGGLEPQHCSGHTPHENLDPAPLGRYFTADGVNIRTFPHISCTSLAHGYRSHVVNYFCYRSGDAVTRNGRTYYTWTYLLNVTIGVTGWVSDAYLAANSAGSTGSTVHCDR